jgi:TonB family protein
MKQKIKIMNHKQQPSDEEIQGYMNFDRLLEHRKVAINASRLTTVFKWGVPLLIGTLAIIGFFVIQEKASRIEHPIVQKPIELPQSAAPITPVDSTHSVKEEINEAASPKKKVDQSSPVAEKQTVNEPPNSDQPAVIEEGYTQAEPLNGYPDLYDYFNANLVYPASALKDSIQGVQTISFIINKDGKVEQIEVEQSLGEEFEKESKRLIENMPEWKPARLDGKPVRSRISIPITFQIQNIKN